MSDIRSKRPQVQRARVAGLRLTSEERFVMAQIDGHASVADLVGLTGLAPDQLERIVSKLAFDGAVELTEERAFAAVPGLEDGGTASLEDFAVALGLAPAPVVAAPDAPAAPEPPPRPRLRKVVRRPARDEGAPRIPAEPRLDAAAAEPPSEASAEDRTLEDEAAAPEASAVDPALAGRLLELEPSPGPAEEEPLLLEGEDPSAVPTAPGDAPSAAEECEAEIARLEAERNYRQIYEARWRPLPTDARVHHARTAHGSDLLALCFDPDPRVIAAILENPTTGLEQVRLVAFHHRTTTGLEIVARRQDWLRDLLVERRLLRNPMIGEIVLGRVMGPKRVFPTYKIVIDRDIPELTRVKCRGQLRQKWQGAPSEERADLLLRTEARCLSVMTGCTFDAKTTAILCGRPMNSAMFVHMVSKFPATPPGLLAHLYKQAFVRKNPSLKKMLLAHPNMPGDVKRNL